MSAYVLAFLILGATKGRKYLKGYSSEASKDYLFHNIDVVLAVAGLSITALALFIGFGLQNLEQLSSIILFFSISFIALTLSAMVSRFPRRVYTFIADVLADTGVLAIGCGFLVFFEQHFLLPNALLIIYGVFIAVLLVLSSIDFYKYYRYWSLFDGEEVTEANQNREAEADEENRRHYGWNLFYIFLGLLLGIVSNLWVAYFMKILELRQHSAEVWFYSFIGMTVLLIVFGYLFIRHVLGLIRG